MNLCCFLVSLARAASSSFPVVGATSAGTPLLWVASPTALLTLRSGLVVTAATSDLRSQQNRSGATTGHQVAGTLRGPCPTCPFRDRETPESIESHSGPLEAPESGRSPTVRAVLTQPTAAALRALTATHGPCRRTGYAYVLQILAVPAKTRFLAHPSRPRSAYSGTVLSIPGAILYDIDANGDWTMSR
jgi:hypothetical protein